MVGCIKIRNLFTLYASSKKCTRDVSEVTAVSVGSKKYTRNSVGYSLRLRVQKMHSQQCRSLFAFVGSKKYTRDVGVVTAVFMGSKKCTHNVSEVTAVFMGSKKCTRNNVGCSLSLRVQKKCTRDASEVTAVFMG